MLEIALIEMLFQEYLILYDGSFHSDFLISGLKRPSSIFIVYFMPAVLSFFDFIVVDVLYKGFESEVVVCLA